VPSFTTGTVTTILSEREGLQRVEVDGRPAYVLTQLIGRVEVGDRVVVNTTAVELALGTGGWDVVHWNLARQSWDGPASGHVMKLRYTSLQADTGAAEEGEDYREPESLDGMPVVVCGLHSQVACVAAVFKHLAPTKRLVYVMTDWASLPLALSDLVADLRRLGLLDATVTAGQAFGGDHEAVTVASGLRVAKAAAGADAAVVAGGPGGVGTATRFGFSALEVGGVVRAALEDHGLPLVALRWSDVDSRDRHRGLSHHSTTVLESSSGAVVAIPRGEPKPEVGGHEVVEVTVPDVPALVAGHGLRVETMGRGPEEDPRFYSYAGAAGVLAAGV
jgi:hypothetical protein